MDLTEVARAVLEAQASLERHHLELDAPAERINGEWDRGRVAQILRNLLSNAIKYSPNGGTIRVRLTQAHAAARVSVSDEGMGIAPDGLARLFDRFYRARQAREDRLPGLGLGLYITRSLVEAHGGTISVMSDGPGKGSCFEFTLPYHAPAPTPA